MKVRVLYLYLSHMPILYTHETSLEPILPAGRYARPVRRLSERETVSFHARITERFPETIIDTSRRFCVVACALVVLGLLLTHVTL